MTRHAGQHVGDRQWLAATCLVAVLISQAAAHCAVAQTTGDKAAAPSPAVADNGGEKPGASTPPAVPDNYKLNLLIRTTIVALNQANQTGNYSVLRDLASPDFQTTNDDAALAISFSDLRGRKLDLSPILFYDPKLVGAPAVQSNGILRLTGFFETAPERVVFDLGFQFVRDQWRLAAIIVEMRPAAATGTEQVLTAPPQNAQPRPNTK